MQIGDIITHIEGKSVEAIVDSVRSYYPASNEAARKRDIADDLLRSNNDAILVDYISSGEIKQEKISTVHLGVLYQDVYRTPNTAKSYKFLDKDIGYVNLDIYWGIYTEGEGSFCVDMMVIEDITQDKTISIPVAGGDFNVKTIYTYLYEYSATERGICFQTKNLLFEEYANFGDYKSWKLAEGFVCAHSVGFVQPDSCCRCNGSFFPQRGRYSKNKRC
ncbi:hypothetical protein [uncultured Proteiniphilum sp.]|uniref:hypothetical protein n=1 Tax=uncultured Proteiniphilum sp. TaxID=497637 RepID=UPI00261290FB|nr:hypothetical protein [uncultured Proteiniphilum sp.]